MLTDSRGLFRLLIALAVAAGSLVSIGTIPAIADDGCDPVSVETCHNLPYATNSGCEGNICDSESQFCCLN